MTTVTRKIGIVTLMTIVAGAGTAVGQDIVIVPAGSTWTYLDDGSNQGTAWRAPAFDDGDWSSGPAQLGYGDGDEETEVEYGPDPDDKFITTYFRHAFEVTDPPGTGTLRLRVLRDDGIVIYLNGQEVHRANLPGSTITYLTPASGTVSGSSEDLFFEDTANAALLKAGTNVLAAEIHQRSGTSSDISFDFELLLADGIADLVRGPYWQRVTPTSAVVQWRTDTFTDSIVRYGTTPDTLDQVVSRPEFVVDHAVTLEGLTPRTRYYYSIESKQGVLVAPGPEYTITTAPPDMTATPTRVWVIGDSGTANENAEAVRDAYLEHEPERPADMWLMLGDNAYSDGTDSEYQAAVFEMYPMLLRNTPLWSTLGNHDAVSADSATESGPYYDIFTLPRAGEGGGLPSGTEAYYSFDYGNIHFVCLDSQESSRHPDGAMLTWLEEDLADTLADWIVAYWHHPPYTKGTHDSDSTSDSGGRMRDMRENALPILEAGGVDLVLSGHSHVYERSFLIDGHYDTSDTIDPAMLVDDGDGRVDGDGVYSKPPGAAHAGAVYVVAGSSGIDGSGSLDHPAMFIGLSQLGSL
ncbi:MAG: metallophosphoesterase family protein, partial [Phycisphaerales bacterium]|nr:metallophosphoesterase family protein [Phycisphaerales bacterium]